VFYVNDQCCLLCAAALKMSDVFILKRFRRKNLHLAWLMLQSLVPSKSLPFLTKWVLLNICHC